MKKICALFVSLILVIGFAVSPVFAAAGGGKVQGDNSAQGDVQGDLSNNEDAPGDDAMGNQVGFIDFSNRSF